MSGGARRVLVQGSIAALGTLALVAALALAGPKARGHRGGRLSGWRFGPRAPMSSRVQPRRKLQNLRGRKFGEGRSVYARPRGACPPPGPGCTASPSTRLAGVRLFRSASRSQCRGLPLP